VFVERELEKMRVQNENTVKEAREETELQMQEEQYSLRVIINRQAETISDLCRLKEKASRKTSPRSSQHQ
jgi:hypothetical protein